MFRFSRGFLPVFFCLTVLFPVFVQAEEFTADSTLKAATVYTNRATLTRQAVIEIPAGAHSIVFKGLPANILTDSLRTEGTSTGSVTFGALTHKRVIEAELTVPREKELNDQLEALEDQKKIAQAEKKALGVKQEFLERLGQHSVDRSNEEISDLTLNAEDWTKAAEAIHTGVSEILKADLAYDGKIRALDEQITKIRREMAQLRTGARNTYQVTVPLEAERATKLTVSLMYQVPNASWRPLYDARLDTESGDLKLVQYGAVRQNTGEDWTDVALTLSTAQPHRGTDLPPLSPMWVNVWENKGRGSGMVMSKAARNVAAPQAMMAMEMDAVASEGFAMGDRAELKEEEVRFAGAQIETGGFVSEYKIPGPSTVSSDGSESKLMIGSFETENKLQIHVKPQFSTNAILAGRIKLKGEAPILPGQASLFRDGAYVGQAYLPLLRPEEETDLAFGIDDQIAVERHVMKDEKGEDGVLSKDNTQERHFKTIVKNQHTMPVELVVFETVPVAQDDKIKIDILSKITTQGYKEDTDDVKGLLSWTKTLEAQKDMTVNLGWKVSWPNDHHINGL